MAIERRAEKATMKTAAVILAAGQGTRMKSDLAKVLHTIDGRPMLSFVVDSVREFGPEKAVVVIGYQGERVRQALGNSGVEFVVQEEQLGTGHAVLQCEQALAGFQGTVLVLNGDVPLLRPETLREFSAYHAAHKAAGTVLTAVLPDASGYGRIVRAPDDALLKIVEHKDARPQELDIREVNSGLFCFEKNALFDALHGLDRDNAQAEYYLTDVIESMRSHGLEVRAYRVEDEREVSGVNNVEELETIRRYFQDWRR
jgi:bifunctional UDP-N-acetylglucosamine pyrophosphorylase/glucosamine-1-phosphate N-acetyltransferase